MLKESIIFLVGMILYFIGTYHSKIYADTLELKYAILSSIEFLITTISWLVLLSYVNKLAIVGAIWSIVCCFITLFLAFVVFHESITVTQMVGLVFGFISIVLMSI
jgi:uncharacterized membrane protein